jgi:tRNA (adenine22-N1)-methyltransferase
LKLSKRIAQIEKMVTSQYDHIWDCCCDHGLLGVALLSRSPAANIHFVDIVPELMVELERKLERFYPNLAWTTHCDDVAKLPLAQYEGKHLIIIAGVGGDLMINFIEHIHQKHHSKNIEFLLCPVHHQFSLRQKLIELTFSLKDEVLVEDNQRFYEIIHVSSTADENNKISPAGEKIWHSRSAQQKVTIEKYLNKNMSHYQRIQQGFQRDLKQTKSKSVQHIIDAYSAVKL